MSMDNMIPEEEAMEADEAGFFGPQKFPAKPLGIDEIKSIIQRELEDGLGGLGSQVSEERRTAIRMYYGRRMGNEIKDRSQVIMMDVLEVVEWTMPSLMRMFTGGMNVVRFKANKEAEQKNADLASRYINHIFMNRLNGFQILYDWFKTALLEKNGIIKVYYKEERHPVISSFTGLTEDELTTLLDNDEVTPIAVDSEEKDIQGVGVITCYNLTMREWKTTRGAAIDGVPPEEFINARRMITLDDNSPFTAHRKKMTVSQLVSEGFDFDEIANLPNDDSPEYSQGRTERLSEDETYPISTAERTDAASRELWVSDCYIKLDEDGDGYAELRRVLIVGEQSVHILEDVEVNQNPFCSITPVPMPHKFYGMSLADLVGDLQQIRSTILRQIMDHIYLSTNPRLAILEGQVELDDLLTVRPGGLVRQRSLGAIEPIQLPPLPREAFQALTYLEEVRANRTGIMAHGRELDASAINSTATGLAQLMAEKQQKIELIARIFANTGMKDMFRKLLRETVENATKEEQIEINGEWMTFDPRDWDTDMNLDIDVGLGAGQAIERLSNLEKIEETQGTIVGGGGLGYMVTPKNIYNLAIRKAEASGFKNADLFFTDPETMEPPEEGPSEEEQKMQLEAIKLESETKSKSAEMELTARRDMELVRHRAEELAMKERIEMARIEMQERLGLGQQQAAIEAAQINATSQAEEGERNDQSGE
jgi:hypothetical protein